MSNSKNQYMGMKLKRVNRSEFDDNKLRELSRQDARLGVQMKTVDRARNVMLKSMDAEKQLFIKNGMQSNTRLTKSSQSPNTRHTSQLSAQRSRLVSDTRAKRSSVTEQRESEGAVDNVQNTVPKSSKEKADSASDQPIETTDYGETSVFDSSSIYDKFLESNASVPTKSSEKDRNENTPKVKDAYGVSMASEARGTNGRSSTGKTSNETQGVMTSTRNDSIGRSSNSPAHHSNVSNVSNVHRGSVETENGNKRGTITKSSVISKDQNTETNKKPTVWETLSTPKHTAMTRAKRNQVEKEFISSNPNKNKSSSTASSPLYLSSKTTSSARVKSGASKTKTSHSTSGSHQGRQPGEIKGMQLTPQKGRNDI